MGRSFSIDCQKRGFCQPFISYKRKKTFFRLYLKKVKVTFFHKTGLEIFFKKTT
jgi:hypothetical protein